MPYKDKDAEKAAKKRYEEKRKKENGERRKCWTLLFYADSAPVDWKDQLSDMHMPVWVGYHDRDVWRESDQRKNPAHVAGTDKKPHYHLVAQYEVQVDRNRFLHDFGWLNGPENVEAVDTLRSIVRYLAHLDDPDKAQYDREGIMTFGGAARDVIDEIGTGERHAMLRDMRRFIRDNYVVDFCEFVDYCDDYEAAWSRLLDDNSSYVIEKYIKSRRYMLKEQFQQTCQGASQAQPGGTPQGNP